MVPERLWLWWVGVCVRWTVGRRSCAVCGALTRVNPELEMWLCKGRCSDRWREAEQRIAGGDWLPTEPYDLF